MINIMDSPHMSAAESI